MERHHMTTIKDRFSEYIRHRNEADAILLSILEDTAQSPDVEMVSVGEAARLLKRTPETVRRWAEQGRLRKIGRNITVESMKQLASGRPR
jgi:uncharacterized membrane protein YccC